MEITYLEVSRQGNSKASVRVEYILCDVLESVFEAPLWLDVAFQYLDGVYVEGVVGGRSMRL